MPPILPNGETFVINAGDDDPDLIHGRQTEFAITTAFMGNSCPRDPRSLRRSSLHRRNEGADQFLPEGAEIVVNLRQLFHNGNPFFDLS